MAPFPEEVDVFTAPHWRMKQLVGLYCDKLSKTNFSNNNDFRALLQSLYATFKEFKMHEQIENEYIIGLLQQRSRTIYNVHSDNKLSEMLSLFEKGLKNVKNECEQLNYAKQLKERLEAFTRDFLPHMKEEEEVFQPMLMEYFTYEELKDIKKKVIAQHRSQKETSTEIRRGGSLWNQAEEFQKAFKYSVDEKTDQALSRPLILQDLLDSLATCNTPQPVTLFLLLLCRLARVPSQMGIQGNAQQDDDDFLPPLSKALATLGLLHCKASEQIPTELVPESSAHGASMFSEVNTSCREAPFPAFFDKLMKAE